MEKPLIELLNMSIKWKKHKTNIRYFFCEIEGDALLLRLNDFPDEPLLTIIRGTDVLDIDDVPENWNVPFI